METESVDGTLPTRTLPLLRHRAEGEFEFAEYEHPTTITGHVVAVDENFVRISEGPNLAIELIPLDFSDTFGGDFEAIYALFTDAGAHKDLVKISLEDSRIAYDNEAQAKRFAATAN